MMLKIRKSSRNHGLLLGRVGGIQGYKTSRFIMGVRLVGVVMAELVFWCSLERLGKMGEMVCRRLSSFVSLASQVLGGRARELIRTRFIGQARVEARLLTTISLCRKCELFIC